MNCSQYEDLLAAHVEGLLERAAEQQLGAHLAECEACRTALEETRRLVRLLNEDRCAAVISSIAPVVIDRIVHEQATRLRRYGMMKKVARISVAAAVVAGVAISFSYVMLRPLGGRALRSRTLGGSQAGRGRGGPRPGRSRGTSGSSDPQVQGSGGSGFRTWISDTLTRPPDFTAARASTRTERLPSSRSRTRPAGPSSSSTTRPGQRP